MSVTEYESDFDNDVYSCNICSKKMFHLDTSDDMYDEIQDCNGCLGIFCAECLHICSGKDCEHLLCKTDYNKNNGLCQKCVKKKG